MPSREKYLSVFLALALDDASAPKPLQCTAQATDPEKAPAAQPLHDATFDHDIVTDEVERWKRLEDYKIKEVTDDDGVVNEMALLFSLRATFPLHYCVFKQVVSHLCHEGNTEQLFSLSGALSDDNCKMHPDNLATKHGLQSEQIWGSTSHLSKTSSSATTRSSATMMSRVMSNNTMTW